jgi:hypothetical protein
MQSDIFTKKNTVAAQATLYFTVAAAGRHAVEPRRRRQLKYSVAVRQRKEIKKEAAQTFMTASCRYYSI